MSAIYIYKDKKRHTNRETNAYIHEQKTHITSTD